MTPILPTFEVFVPVKMAQVAMTTSAVTVYTTPAETRSTVQDIIIANTTAGALTYNVFLVPASGTAGTFPATVAITTTSGQTGITFSADPTAAGLRANSYFTIAGVTGTKRLVSVDGTTGIINSAADASVSGAAGTYVAPVWKNYGAIAV